MTQEAVYFVVTARNARESPALYYGLLPRWMTGKRAKERGLVYALRLDILPHADRWLSLSVGELYRIYLDRKAGHRLPASNIIPAKANGGSTRKLGDWWRPLPVTWDRKAPADPAYK